ncbi:MAG: hypothetical protein ACLQU4_02590 [Limisphaerales bacterium]
MKTNELFPDEVTVAPNCSEYELNIVGVYQDPLTQSWGVPMCRLATQLAGEDRIRNTWYDVHSLADIDIFLDAIRAALVADVIVIATGEIEWMQTWRFRMGSSSSGFSSTDSLKILLPSSPL